MKEVLTLDIFTVPDRKKVMLFLVWGFILYGLFILSYATSNWFNSTRTDHYELYFEWETRIPLVPGFIIAYSSILLFFLVPLFYLKNRSIHLLAVRYLFVNIVSCLIFIVLPAKLGFQRTIPEGFFMSAFQLLHKFDKPFNMFPSLHISYASLTYFSLLTINSKITKWVMSIWFLVIIASVILVNQHHFADIAGGLAMAKLSEVIIRTKKIT